MSFIAAKDKRTEYVILVDEKASVSEQYAARELASFLFQMTEAVFPVQVGSLPADKCIVVGGGEAARAMGVDVAGEQLGDEGFILKTQGERLVIAGGAKRGTLYGVYTFLEKLGCRWFSSKVSHIPTRTTLKVPCLDERQVPVLEYRESYWVDSMDGAWAARNKNNGQTMKCTAEQGGNISYFPFVHTFESLVPVDEYFESHPEYFSLVNGERCGEKFHTQLCLTNPDVLALVIRKVRQWIEEHPEASIISVSQNDWYNYCECDACRAIDEAEGSHAGTLIHFVNQVAEAIEKDYPHIVIDTLAYQYTRPAPKHVRPRHNVCVRLCSIECCFAHPLAQCDEICSFADKVHGDSFQHDLKEWAKVCDRLYVWDYVVNFSHYFMPFPNFHVLKENIQFFIDHNVKGIFEEGATAACGKCELAELRSYVLTHLLWDPTLDTDTLVEEFMVGYFGNAAQPLMAYYRMIHQAVEANPDIHFGIYDPPRIDYLTPIMPKLKALFDKAEAMADNDEILQRVEIARLPIRYFEIMKQPVDTEGRTEAIEALFGDFARFGIDEIWEGRTMEQARERIEQPFKRRWE